MDIRKTIQIFNLVLAISAVLPSMKLSQIFIKERKLINKGKKRLNRILIILFGGTAVVSVINTIVSLLSVFGNQRIAHNISPFSRTFINLFLLFVSWSLYRFHKKINE